MERSGEKVRRPLKVAVIGSRGIPGNYGGFETFAERLGLGLVERGHFVNVYCPAASSTTDEKEYKASGGRSSHVRQVTDKLSGSACRAARRIFGCDTFSSWRVAAVLAGPRLTDRKIGINRRLEWKRRSGEIWRLY
jgi:hypothetical protein